MLVVDLDTGAVRCWLNQGANKDAKPRGWVWNFVGEIFTEKLDDGVGVFFADVDGFVLNQFVASSLSAVQLTKSTEMVSL